MYYLKAVLVGVALSVLSAVSFAQTSTTFTYQGVLRESGAAANGSFEMDFSLWDALSGGAQVGATVNAPAQGVADGLFSIELDFGAAAFGDSQFWLEIAVDGSILTPRQLITASPFSVQTRGIFVDDIGNIGIGTTTPGADLDVLAGSGTRVRIGATPAANLAFQYFSGGLIDVPGSTFGMRMISPENGHLVIDVPGNDNNDGLYVRVPTTIGPSPVVDRTAFVVKASGNVGVGVTNPAFPLHIATPSSAPVTVFAQNTQTNGFAIRGAATATGGTGRGLSGTSDAFLGSGVFGHATSTSGTNYGVQGRTESVTGRGVYGEATVTTGANSGVYGRSASTFGTGVYGEAIAITGANFGVNGRSASTTGTGVYGEATATSGETYGVYGTVNSPGAIGVYGSASEGVGVSGFSSLYRGVWGESVSNRGVYGQSSTGTGVLGNATASTGVTYGVYGWSQSPNGFGVYSASDFGGSGAKFFIQPHPSDPSKEIRFVCLEGNESGTYFRGSSQLDGGRAYIEVPEEFRLVSETDGLTVQLTARGPNAGLWIESSDLNLIVVVGNGDVQFDYFVNGVRRGFADHESFRENNAYVPEVRGIPFGTQFRPGHRQILVDNGILNPDFTPNERTAARMGWKLRDPKPEELRAAAPAPLAHK
jgi:hypothetical protein